MSVSRKIGLIAGNGALPLIFASALRGLSYSIFAIAHEKETDPQLAQKVDKMEWIQIGQIGTIIPYFKRQGVSEILMAGGIPKTHLFDANLDKLARTLIDPLPEKQDNLILVAFASACEKEGIQILSVIDTLPSLLATECEMTHPLTKSEQEDIAWGWRKAKQIGALDIGQCIVVKDGVLLAVEAVEGTDAAIRRGGLLGGDGVRVVKCLKPHQDIRLDLPTVGPQTIQTMMDARASVLAIEAGATILIEKERMLKMAKEAGIAVVGGGIDHLHPLLG
ncbi:MAG: UDP-2,3-diacylglucosamine diphosphatase LpxI [Nitrospirae bacterium]|nr:UDP-2,3-diacylglucosamine diphosphatase LpxI [Candidatus Troglogloeales bacterium]